MGDIVKNSQGNFWRSAAVVGAVGMEMVASQIIHWGWDIRYYLAAPFVEELLEMSAIALFIIVLLQYVQEKTAEIRLVIKA